MFYPSQTNQSDVGEVGHCCLIRSGYLIGSLCCLGDHCILEAKDFHFSTTPPQRITVRTQAKDRVESYDSAPVVLAPHLVQELMRGAHKVRRVNNFFQITFFQKKTFYY